jgi:hypothetical protein
MSASPGDEVSVLQNLFEAVSTGNVLVATAKLGLIDHMTSGPKDANELAQACATDPSMTTRYSTRLPTSAWCTATSPAGTPWRSAAPRCSQWPSAVGRSSRMPCAAVSRSLYLLICRTK